MDILPEIDLSENRITNNTIDKLIETLKTTKFKKLNLESVFTKNNKQETFEILRKICEVIKESTNLEELIISKNALGKSGAKALKVFLTNNVNLKHLIIDDAGLGEGGTVILESLLNSRRKTSYLETFSIKENVLGKQCSKLLSMSLSLCKKLQIINLEDNFFTKKTSKMLSRSLANWPDLKQLIINDCLICKKGVIYILEALLKGTNKNIEYLGFQYCSIDENGFYTLASIIKKSLMLKVVEINGNYSIKKKCMSKLNLVSKKNGTLINGFDDLINEDDEGEEKEGKEKEGKEKELDDNEVEEIHNDMKGKGHDGKEGKEEEGLDVEEEEGDYDEKEGKEEEGLDVEEEEGDYDGKEE
ncbi:Ran GTPase-activating protein 1 [Rhizophagus irregularis DAOM 181602=DAOM 197198]|nr:Ran GTPase-activating protein 1 [Rhizophagus irregularis DAOM 181602=DAOM 197198]GET61867.1 Ran GTPase-activating protein 1 [Rhizophagus irregularis DAOM 181602=DAOM 197198]GET65961.1 Ran GTPase-activating protein 1 [Rhizophagus irregularis DAOM 181602=DAOM 197198]